MRFDVTNPICASKLAVACALLTLASCASVTSSTPEEQVKARAQARQDAILKGDQKRAYEYFTPGYRATVSAATYLGTLGTAVQRVSATVETVHCDTLEKCVAEVKLEMKQLAVRRFTGTITTHANETWLLEAGQWWLFQTL